MSVFRKSNLLKDRKNSCLLILSFSFFIPALILFFSYALLGVFPFGDKSILIMDMSNQYTEFFSGLKSIVTGENSIFFSWNKSLGDGYIGVFSYYLSSPLSFLTLFFSNRSMPFALMLLSILKTGLCGLTFALYLKSHFKKTSYSILIFSSLYALMGYCVVYSMCPMWIDGVIWLPVILIGVDKLLHQNKIFLLSISLFFLFVSNYYISYMVGIFVFLYFIKEICLIPKTKFSFYLKKTGMFFLSTIIAAAVAAFILLPTFFSLIEGKLNTFNFTPKDLFSKNIASGFAKLLPGAYDSITNSGTPNIYSGLITVFLSAMFFINKKISLKEKLLNLGILIIYISSFVFVKIDIFFHIFQYPNWFPFRYSFVFSALLLMMAYKSFRKFDKLSIEQVSIVSFIILISFIIIFIFKDNFLNYTVLIFSAVLLLLYMGLFLLLKSQKSFKPLIIYLIFLLTIFELTFSTKLQLDGLDNQFKYESYEAYQSNYDNLTPLVEKAKSEETEFFRMDKTFERSKNEAIAFNYNGITHFSSAFNKNINSFLKKLGFSQTYFWSSYMGSTLFTDSFFDVKYIMSRGELPDLYEIIDNKNDIKLYKNPYALKLCSLVDNSFLKLKLTDSATDNQNNIFNELTNSDINLFEKIECHETNLYNMFSKKKNVIEKIDSSLKGGCSYHYSATIDGSYYVFLSGRSSALMRVNGNYLMAPLNQENKKRAIYIGDFEAGDDITISFDTNNKTIQIDSIDLYSFNNEVFVDKMTDFNNQNSIIKEVKNGYVECDVKITKDQALLTTIPYSDGWSAYIDDKQAEINKFDNTLISIEMPEGQHNVKLVYQAKGSVVGFYISVSTLILICIIYFLKKFHILEKINNKKTKKE